MRLVQVLLAICAFGLAAPPALAAPKDAVLNKEGYWGIDVDNGACAASMTLQGAAVFLLRAQDGKVSFGLFAAKPMARGKAGRIETEAYGFDFQPSYGDDASTLFYEGELDARALAALRLARQARVLIDGKPVASMTLEGTGFEGALDGVVACSKGESGWWGKGVGAQAAPAAAADDGFVYHPDGVWGIYADRKTCIAQAAAPDERVLQLLAVAGRVGLAVGAKSDRLPRGRKVRVQTDSYEFTFKPEYDGGYMNSADLLESPDVFALRRAKRMRISADGRELVDVELGAAFAEILDGVAACSRGEPGWWGKGASEPLETTS